MNVSAGMASWLIRRLEARLFAQIDPDDFYRYDEERPVVSVEGGILKRVSTAAGSLYTARTSIENRDIIILEADEPNIRWQQFTEGLLSLCRTLMVETVVTLGSMHDRVLHSDRIISAVTSDENLMEKLRAKKVQPVNYKGPGSIHSMLQFEAQKRGFKCISLWCHCPYYLHGVTHYGLLSELLSIIGDLGEFTLERDALEKKWEQLHSQIQELIEQNPEALSMVNQIRKARLEGSWKLMKRTLKKGEKIIDLKEFLENR